MKKFRFSNKLLMGAAIAVAMSVSFSSCSDDDEEIIPCNCPAPSTDFGTVIVSGDITTDTRWTADNVYFLNSRVIVKNGATLTIDAGTIIKGNPGAEANAKPLVIAKGSKIMAMGTAQQPIIFTASADNIEPGQITGTNLDETARGLWAGLIILGDAPISSASGVTDRIEGIPASVAEGIYGGSNPTDNSGELHYISIRHGGVELVPGGGNEINGLTMGGVGSGTIMDHIEVVANLDDGIEWFGGTANMDHALVGYQGDDAFDIDQAFSGTVTNVAYIQGLDSDHAFEIDGPEGAANGGFTINGGKLMGKPNGTRGEYADFRDGAQGTIENLYFSNFNVTNADVELDDDQSSANYNSSLLVMTGCVFNTTVSLGDIAKDNSTNPPAGFDFDAVFTAANSIGTNTPSFDKSQFTGWTWADANGELTSF